MQIMLFYKLTYRSFTHFIWFKDLKINPLNG
jgi:hypothetical protein